LIQGIVGRPRGSSQAHASTVGQTQPHRNPYDRRSLNRRMYCRYGIWRHGHGRARRHMRKSTWFSFRLRVP
jgi:hypothetical protein